MDLPGTSQHLTLADGTVVRVRFHGPADADPVVLVHGWGLDSDEWSYALRELGDRYRLIAWDLPGLGQSGRPPDRDWSLEKLARQLDAVVALAGDRPVTLVGHSIGGMILLTYCKLFHAALGTRVRGLVLAHTTYTNPVKTTRRARAVRRPAEAGPGTPVSPDGLALPPGPGAERHELPQRVRPPLHGARLVLGERDEGSAQLPHAAITARHRPTSLAAACWRCSATRPRIPWTVSLSRPWSLRASRTAPAFRRQAGSWPGRSRSQTRRFEYGQALRPV